MWDEEYTTKQLRTFLASALDNPKGVFEVQSLTGALLVGISRDLEALTAKVDAIYASLPGNQKTDANAGKEGWCDICGRSFDGTRCEYCGAHHGPDDDD